jgi:hypothetical protein
MLQPENPLYRLASVLKKTYKWLNLIIFDIIPETIVGRAIYVFSKNYY